MNPAPGSPQRHVGRERCSRCIWLGYLCSHYVVGVPAHHRLSVFRPIAPHDDVTPLRNGRRRVRLESEEDDKCHYEDSPHRRAVAN